MTIYERIKLLREEQGLSQQALAEKVGFKTASAINKIELGLRDINQTKILAFAKALSTTPSYLMGDVDEEATTMPTAKNIIPMPKMNKIPLLGTIACGEPILAEENISDIIDVPEHINADFALRCKGNSMIDVHINDGDIVYIRQQPTVNNGQIAAVLIGEEATLKKVYLSGDTLTLIACNSEFAPLVYSGAELEGIRILGKAVAYTSVI